MRFDLTTLRLFLAVIDHGSITKAAEQEHIVASAVSKRLSDLEMQLGIPLLTRQHDGVVATPAGVALAQHARDVIRAVDRIPGALSTAAGDGSLMLRVRANMTATVGYLLDDLNVFLSPKIKIRLEERRSLPTIDAVVDGSADLGVIGYFQPGDRLQVRPYRRVPLMLVVPPAHPVSGRDAIRFAEALEFDLITLMEGTAIHSWAIEAGARIARKPRLVMEVTSYESMRKMVQAGLGIAVIPAPNIVPYRIDRASFRRLIGHREPRWPSFPKISSALVGILVRWHRFDRSDRPTADAAMCAR
jgi:DNA-binding transcriptional LysR family regulator